MMLYSLLLVVLLNLFGETLPTMPNRQEEYPEIKRDLTIEILLHFDYTLYAKWLAFKDGVKSLAKKAIAEYYAYAVREANVIYENIDSSNFSFSLRLSKITFGTVKSMFTKATKETVVEEPPMVEGIEALKMAEKWNEKRMMKKKRIKKEKYDLVVVIGSLNMENTMAITNLSSCCSRNPLIVLRETDSPEFIYSLAHEIGHTLGALHDGYGNGCNMQDLYLMSPSNSLAEEKQRANINKFSTCSLREIESFIRNLDSEKRNCLTNRGKGLKISKLAYPGQKYSLEEQCQMIYGPKSYFCKGGRICREMLCYLPGERGCLIRYRQAAADGTPCGDGMWCFRRECVHDGRAPPMPGALDGCPYGDYSGKNTSSNYCEIVERDPKKCYQTFSYTKCCQTCQRLAGRKGCEWADRYAWCRPVVSSHPETCRVKSIAKQCCQSCADLYSASDLASKEPVDTEECPNLKFWCDSYFIGMCYERSDLCCGICSIIANPKEKGCEYGDRIGNCTPEICTKRRDECCHTCSTNSTNTANSIVHNKKDTFITK